MTTNERIRQLKDELGLTHKELAAELRVSLHTVVSWFRPPANKGYNKAPKIALRCLEFIADEMEKYHD